MTCQKLGGALALALALAAGTGSASAADELTAFPWLVTASDVAGRPWSSSLLVFTSQVPEGDGYKIEGYFDWFLNNVPQGREMVRGTMSASGGLDFAGYELIDPGAILLDVYRARYDAADGTIVNGTFGVPQGISGVWSATQTLKVSVTKGQNSDVELCWDTGVNFWYQVQFRDDAASGTWAPVTPQWKQGTGQRDCVQLAILPGTPEQLYRVVITDTPPSN